MRSGYLWTGHVPGQWVIYQWQASRAADCLNSLLGEEFKGKVQCDGYSAYPAFARDKPGILLFECWAHARRLVFEPELRNAIRQTRETRERGRTGAARARTTQSRFCSLFSRPLACLADLTSGFGLKPKSRCRGQPEGSSIK